MAKPSFMCPKCGQVAKVKFLTKKVANWPVYVIQTYTCGCRRDGK